MLPPLELPPSLAAALIDALPDGVLVAGDDLVVRHANRTAEAMLDHAAGALVGRALPTLYWDPADGTHLAVADRRAPGEPAPHARAMRTAGGARRVYLAHTLDLPGALALVLRDPGDL